VIKMSRCRVSLLILSAALLASGCMHATRKPQTQAQAVRLEGELTKGQFGCLQVKTADGERYSLARDLDGSKPGQRVWVEGYLVKTKGCMPGKSLMPQKAGLLDAPAQVAATDVAGR
jgi:hypothetical protein